MEISRRFLDILKSINYHVGHLPKELFANEEQLPELLPIFTMLINSVTLQSNCLTPKELALQVYSIIILLCTPVSLTDELLLCYTSIASKHDNFSSIEKVSKAIDKFYDETTKDAIICSSDLEAIERKILKSQQELTDLKAHGTLYEKKIYLMDDEISLLQQKENTTSLSCFKTESNLDAVMKKFTEEVDTLGSNVNKLHNHVTSSMTSDHECLTKLASNNLINLTDLWRQQIFKMIDVWFKEENISSIINDKFSTKIHTLSQLSQSCTALKMAGMNKKCEISKLNMAVNNILNIKNYFNEDKENLYSNNQDIKNYIDKYIKHIKDPEVIMDINGQSQSTEYDNIQSRISETVIADATQKLSELETINGRLTFIQDSIEHYIMICDVLWCLMRTGCSMANLKCELVLHCINALEKTFDDITFAAQSTLNQKDTEKPKTYENYVSTDSEFVKFDGYKHYSSIYTNSNEIEKLSKMVQQWKSKYHYSRDECNQLATLQQNLKVYSDTVNDLTSKYSNTMQ
ncbi:hypothetical protein AGLY_014496 [Aphis glycines]|uniref:Uncharacterized protein n=1 Tax=Aphis glycines TaxID=307491 RepID=A0A6G0T3J4_APHGL|nr:hypothetical protein AGLY_014496 [Aphis glycines]